MRWWRCPKMAGSGKGGGAVRTPQYFFTGDFQELEPVFRGRPHRERAFRKGEFLWAPDRPFQEIHYLLSGAAQTYVEHEQGRRKIISFHGVGTVFPVYHGQDFKLERSIVSRALEPVRTLAFTREEFGAMLQECPRISELVVEWYARYVNLLLYETAHQEYNSSFLKLCNLLYLLLSRAGGGLDITQDDLADLLGISRVNLTRGLAQLRRREILRTRRGLVELLDLPALAQCCSEETHP